MLRSFDDTYYPNLITRGAEMRAINELPENIKDTIFPVLRICPWVSSKEFQNTHNKIVEVYDVRPIICDVDRSYSSDAERNAVTYFFSLFNGENRTKNWINLISENENYIPCIQHVGFSDAEVQQQITSFVVLERGMVFRVEPSTLSEPERIIKLINQTYDLVGNQGLCVILDLGLISDLNISEAAAIKYLEQLIELDDLRIIISSASFPREFSSIDGVDEIPIKSRELFVRIRRRYNQLQLSYSDWASTKPRTTVGGGRPLPRIDYPRNSNWIASRSKEKEWDYVQAAGELSDSRYWTNPPNVWGVQMIERTSLNDPYGIDSPQKGAAARINIHLFIQNHYGSEAGSITTDEPWQDL